MVVPNGQVGLIARATKLVGPGPVRLLNGDRATGYRLHLTKLTSPTTERRLTIRWYAIGQFRYFNARNWSPMILGPVSAPTEKYLDNRAEGTGGSPPSVPFAGGIPGLRHGAPEAQLVREYVDWVGAHEEFGHDYLRSERLYTDLFDKRHWR